MAAWKKICCPVDFSWESRIAMEEAADLAWRFGGDLTLLHVDTRAAEGSPGEGREQGTAELERKLAAWRDQAEPIATTTVTCALAAGGPAEEIVRFAREGGHDTIVLGSCGRTGLKQKMLGSVAEYVVRNAHCPVLAVRRVPAP